MACDAFAQDSKGDKSIFNSMLSKNVRDVTIIPRLYLSVYYYYWYYVRPNSVDFKRFKELFKHVIPKKTVMFHPFREELIILDNRFTNNFRNHQDKVFTVSRSTLYMSYVY